MLHGVFPRRMNAQFSRFISSKSSPCHFRRRLRPKGGTSRMQHPNPQMRLVLRWMSRGLIHLVRRLLVVGSIRRIIGGFNFREPLHADGVDLGDPVLEVGPFDIILYLAISENAFQGDELPLLESLGELREIPPGEDAMPFGAGFVVALVVLPALLGCDVEG